MMFLKLTYRLVFLLLIFNWHNVIGQDLHFSQFYANPLNLNPAMTGYMGGDNRAHINYKNQWQSISNPYRTLSLSYDRHFLREKLNGNWLGGGLQIINDQAGTSQWSNLKVLLNMAYIHKISPTSYLSSGLQLGMIQQSFNANDLFFDAQILPSGVNTSLPTNENLQNFSRSALDIGFGMLFGSKPNEKLDIYSGFSFGHINKAKVSFVDLEYQLQLKTTFHAGLTYKVNSNFYFQPSMILQHYSTSKELIMGSAIAYDLTSVADEKTFLASFGAWYRSKDAFIPYAALEIEAWKFGISYDINTSPLSAASSYRGGLELSLKWEIPTFAQRLLHAVPCPRF